MSRPIYGPVAIVPVEWKEGSIPSGGSITTHLRIGQLLGGGFPKEARLILGKRASAEISPDALYGAVRGRSCFVVVCDPAPEHAARFRRTGFVDIVNPCGLASWLEGHRDRIPRPVLAPPDWAAVPMTGVPGWIEDVLRIVSALCAVTVSEWAEKSGYSRSHLDHSFRRKLGRTPRQMLWQYTEAVLRAGRAEGMSKERIGRSLGYSSAAAICHAAAIRRSRRECTPPPAATAPLISPHA